MNAEAGRGTASRPMLAAPLNVVCHDFPFRWLHAPRFFEPSLAVELGADSPTKGFRAAVYDGGDSHFSYLPIDTHSIETLPDLWAQVVSALAAPSYRALISRLIGTDLQDCHLQATVCRYSARSWLGPHTDRAHRVATQVIYLHSTWCTKWAGCIRILNAPHMDGVVYRLTPTPNSSVIILRSDRSWHAVEPVRAARTDRLSLLLHWSL
jgi:hypothetical protein